jgi:hypothetical protein
MASLRNLAIGILRHAGGLNIAKALRHNARDASCPLALLGVTTSGSPHLAGSTGQRNGLDESTRIRRFDRGRC